MDLGLDTLDAFLDENGNPHQILIDVTWVNPTAVDRALFNPTKGLDVPARHRKLAEWGFGNRGQGFSFIREGREIVGDRSKGLYLKTQQMNYMHGEIHFPAHRMIDDLFGIQTNKSRFDIDRELSDVLKEQIATVLTQVGNDQLDSQKTRRSLRVSVNETDEERALRSVSSRLPVPIYTEADLEEGERFRKESREKMEKALEKEHAAELVLLRNKRLDESISEDEHEDSQFALKQELHELLRQNEKRYGSHAPVRFEIREPDECEGSAIYVVESRGDECIALLQPTSPFIGLVKNNSTDDTVAKAEAWLLDFPNHLKCQFLKTRQ